MQKGVLRNFTKFTGKHLPQSLFFNKVAGLAFNFIKKEALAQVFSCEFCRVSKNTLFIEHLRTTASLAWNALKIKHIFTENGSVYVVCVVEIASSDPPKKANSVTFSGTQENSLSLTYQVSWRKHFQVKPSSTNSLIPLEHFLLWWASISYKNLKRNQFLTITSSNFTNIKAR